MIAWITARGGSQRLPGKNIRLLAGKPLMAYTIEAASQSSAIDRILLTTDDPLIAAVARDFGVEVPFLRPAELSTSTATSRDVLLHALQYLEDTGTHASAFCLLQPTSPLRTAADIDAAASLFYSHNADAVISACEYDHPLNWMMELGPDQRILHKNPLGFAPSAEQPKFVRPNGAIYMFQCDFYKQSEGYVGQNTFGYMMPRERSVDIDTALDWKLAEVLLQEVKS
jgi:N-acylneuraminate cytidylyltransferase/CMP-N,N'-diacetyllegionaminic acid synthase